MRRKAAVHASAARSHHQEVPAQRGWPALGKCEPRHGKAPPTENKARKLASAARRHAPRRAEDLRSPAAGRERGSSQSASATLVRNVPAKPMPPRSAPAGAWAQHLGDQPCDPTVLLRERAQGLVGPSSRGTSAAEMPDESYNPNIKSCHSEINMVCQQFAYQKIQLTTRSFDDEFKLCLAVTTYCVTFIRPRMTRMEIELDDIF